MHYDLDRLGMCVHVFLCAFYTYLHMFAYVHMCSIISVSAVQKAMPETRLQSEQSVVFSLDISK